MKKIITAIAIAAASLSANATYQPYRMTLDDFEDLMTAVRDDKVLALGYFISVWETRPMCESDVGLESLWTFVQADIIIRDRSKTYDAFTFMRDRMIEAMKCKPGTIRTKGARK